MIRGCSDPGAAILAALESVQGCTEGVGPVWVRFVNGDLCRISKTEDGWTLECDPGVYLSSESLSVRGGPEIVLTASYAKHPAVFRMEFLSASVDAVFVSRDGEMVPILEAERWTPVSARNADGCSRPVRCLVRAAIPRKASPA